MSPRGYPRPLINQGNIIWMVYVPPKVTYNFFEVQSDEAQTNWLTSLSDGQIGSMIIGTREV
jgi:hypothetical protein